MNIFSMLWKNFWGGNRTLRFPARPPAAEQYRGLVCFDPARCTGCAVCKFRCTSRAIEFKAGKGEFTWSYDPGQCTFCGRCVEGCKDNALSQESAPPPVYTSKGALRHAYTVQRKAPVRPAAAPAAAAAPATQDPPAAPAAAEGGAQ